jgi:hypothetical protein
MVKMATSIISWTVRIILVGVVGFFFYNLYHASILSDLAIPSGVCASITAAVFLIVVYPPHGDSNKWPILCRFGLHAYRETRRGGDAGFLAGEVITYTCKRCGTKKYGQTGMGT